MDAPADIYCPLSEFYETYERTGVAVIVLDHAHHVRAVSPLARHLLRENKGPDGRGFESVVESIISGALRRRHVGSADHECSRLVLWPKGRETPLFAFLSEIRMSGPWPNTVSRALLMLIRDPSYTLAFGQRVLIETYGLTRKEANLATYMAAGGDIVGFAVDHFISVYTTKSHLKQIFRKMKVHHQAEMVALVLAVLH